MTSLKGAWTAFTTRRRPQPGTERRAIAAHDTLPLERVRLGERQIVLASFVHPSIASRDNWGANASQPYLLNTVAPTVAALQVAAGILPA